MLFKFTAPSFGIVDGGMLYWLICAGRRQDRCWEMKIGVLGEDERFVNRVVIKGEIGVVSLL